MNATTTLVGALPQQDRLERTGLALLVGCVAALQFSIAAAHILLGLTLACWATLVVLRREEIAAPPIAWPLVGYGILTLVSAAASIDPRESFIDSKQLVLFLIVPAVYRLARGPRAQSVLVAIVSSGAVSAAIGIVEYGILKYDNLGRRPQGLLTHYMTYSGVLMLVTCAAAAWILFRRRDRAWPALVLPALLVALALTFTRSSWVGVAVAIALLLIVRDFRLLATLPIAAAVFFVLAPAALTDRVYSIFDMNDPTNRDRVAMLRAGARMVADQPLTGVGPDMVKQVYADYRDPRAVEPVNFHLHNVPIQIAAERGLPALACWTWFVGLAASQALGRLRSGAGHPTLAAASLAAIAGMLTAGLFEYNFGDSEFLMLFLTLLTLPYAADAESPGEPATP
jgi:O-antigen ligase